MKMSMFKGNKKREFINGVLHKNEDDIKINGTYELYEMSEEMRDKLIKIMDNKKSEISFLYEVLPIISDFEMDISLEEFEKMIKSPSPKKQFLLVIDDVIELVTELKESTDIIVQVSNKVNELRQQLPIVEEVEEVKEPEKTKEEILEELYNQLAEVKSDKVKRTEVLKQINELEVSMEVDNVIC